MTNLVNVENLAKEVVGDFTMVTNAARAAQAAATVSYAAYRDAQATAETHLKELATEHATKHATFADSQTVALNRFMDDLAAEELALTTKVNTLVNSTKDTWTADDKVLAAADALYIDEVKYVISLAGGDSSVMDPTPHPTPVTPSNPV